jgi:NIPSNAP protein
MKKMPAVAAIGAAFVLGFVAHGVLNEPVASAQAQSAGAKVYELRTYTAPEGKLEELHARFKNHTMRIFKKHNMTSVAYFRPEDSPLKENTLIYLISHPSREAAKENWAAFQKDPEWQKVAQESQVNGKIVAKVESVFLDATDYSPMK